MLMLIMIFLYYIINEYKLKSKSKLTIRNLGNSKNFEKISMPCN